ncbi:hypothetical protein SASPL_156230 [Salvia splendens]|uniref:Uncharacterized protein n=1 Tax=Salvia splendens TaxID=180675 RepID=A0A8X8VWY8_SALSN|nr:hypothetical protein SASPL_156230 [Salvia splendens]
MRYEGQIMGILVRSFEDGGFGSWHPGKVIGCKELVRVVEYDHLLCVDGPAKLVEEVKVTPAIDGFLDEEIQRPGEYRGLIRPCPETPTLGLVGARTLQYGACVDLFHGDAWWEGVVFDNKEGCERRRIFFPDLGDEVEGKVDDLRFSKDWDEVTEKWRLRGNWLFLELLEEYEQEYPRLVSVQQIWYEVRTKDDFKNLGEWTSSKRDVWKQLLSQVLYDNIKHAVENLFMNLPCKSAKKQGQTSLKFLEKDFESILKSEEPFRSSLAATAPFEDLQSNDEGIPQTDVNLGSNNQVQIEDDQVRVSVSPTDEQVLSPDPDADSGNGSSSYDESHSLKLRQGRRKSSTKIRRLNWQSAVPQLIPGPQQCPDAIDSYKEYLSGKGTAPKGTAPNGLSLDVSKHLLYLGWKIEFRRTCMGNSNRKCYISPNGKTFHSLPEVFKKFHSDFELEPTSHVTMHPNYKIASYMSSYEETPSPPGKSQASRNLFKLPCITDEKFEIESKYCPKAVRDYCSLASKSAEGKLKGMEARKHLSALGWSFYHHNKGPYGWEIRYRSPTGKMFYSLLSACRWCVKAGALTSTDPSRAMGRVINRDFINNYDGDLSTSKSHLPRMADDSTVSTQLNDMPMSEGFVRSIKCEAHKTRMSRKKRRKLESDCLEVSLASPKRGRKSNASMSLRGDLNADSLTPVRQSSKRVSEEAASSSHQTPRTILSWLIDNNVVLPRAKVHYCSSKNGPRIAEGRISREGIKCSCCGGIFTLSNFEAHVGSSDRRPSANIYLEDGMSLLECQLQLKLRYISRNSRLERQPKAAQHHRKSDDICSVCHYGGDLLLCDLCPSSFHTQCVGLKEVPEGDWFCPSCCCQICNKSRSDSGNKLAKDTSFLTCCQCERRYHAECLTNEGDTQCRSKGDLFCQDTCRQIFDGLNGILGKKIPVGTENMTWTLVKYMESNISKNVATYDDESSVENYSKLNVALSVMHECFEPVKEPRTRRDLMEDIIFNRRSDLNRLNFQGFYTVILEKNDELISAASVRIYGKTVAEVPLVATRFQYRRLGMCRILMNELEKQLAQLGVERLLLPAVPSVLNTWISSFGFSMMDESERLNFLVYTFLDFQGTIFCQKMLKSDLPAENQTTGCDHVDNNADIGVGGISPVSEVLEGKQVVETDIMEQESACNKTMAYNGNAGCSSAEKAIAVVNQPTALDYSSLQPALGYPLLATSNGRQSGSTKVILKYYKRKKISAC